MSPTELISRSAVSCIRLPGVRLGSALCQDREDHQVLRVGAGHRRQGEAAPEPGAERELLERGAQSAPRQRA